MNSAPAPSLAQAPPWWAFSLACLESMSRGSEGLETSVPLPVALPPRTDLWPLLSWWDESIGPCLTKPERARAKELRLSIAAQNLRRLSQWKRIRGQLEDAGIPALPLKGVALLEVLPALGLRPMQDLDVLVPAAQFQEAQEVLAPGRQRDPSGPSTSDHCNLEDEAGPIDLHGQLFNRAIPLWRELVPEVPETYFRSASPAGLSREAQLGIVLAHASKHWWVRERWLLDACVLQGAGIDWTELEAFLFQSGLLPLASVGVRVLTLLGLYRGPVHLAEGPRSPHEPRLHECLRRGELDLRDRRLERFLPMIPGRLAQLRVLRETLLPSPFEVRHRFQETSYLGFLWKRLQKAWNRRSS